MYCRYCGKKLSDNAVICSGCRRPVDPIAGAPAVPIEGSSWSFGTMTAMILATLFLPPFGLIFGVIALRREAKKVQGAVLLTVSIFMMLLMAAIILGL